MNDTPKIRFSEFTDEWEQRKLFEVLSALQNNTLSRADLCAGQGVAKNVHYGDVLIKFGEYLDVHRESLPMIADDSVIAKYRASFLQNGDIIVADTAEDETVGKCTEIAGIDGDIVLSGLHTIPYRPLFSFASGYLGYYMNSDSYHHQLFPLMQGIKVTSISKTAMQNTVMCYPKSEDEQAEISAFFRDLDNLITLHQRKYEQMISVKKSMLGRLFPYDDAKNPQIRFGFSEDWEEVKLGGIIFPYSDPVETPHDGYTRLGIRSHGKGTFHNYVQAGQELETAQMHRVTAHKFIVNITFGWEHAVAITNEQDAGKLVSHRFPQFSMTEAIDDGFLKYVILDERFKHHLFLSSPGGAGRNRVLNIPQMLEYKMRIPKIEEQRQIAGFLDSVNNLIDLYAVKVQKLKQIKSACLDKMFI